MPFCIVTIVVSSSQSGARLGAIAATWCAFTARTTTSCTPASAVFWCAATRTRNDLEPVLADDAHAALANGVEVGAARDERDVFTGGGEPSAHVSADRTGADDRDLHASVPPPTVDSPDRALAHAAEHASGEHRGDEIHDCGGDEHARAIRVALPRRRWRRGTSSDAMPFAVYSRPAFADANVRPYTSAQIAGKRL